MLSTLTAERGRGCRNEVRTRRSRRTHGRSDWRGPRCGGRIFLQCRLRAWPL